MITLCGVMNGALAQSPNYPQRPVRVIVNVSAGGGVDIVARIVAQHLSAALGHTFALNELSVFH